jgi:hypothetical protein
MSSPSECTAERVVQSLVSVFPAFADVVTYQGQQIFLLKKAQLLAADLYRRFKVIENEKRERKTEDKRRREANRDTDDVQGPEIERTMEKNMCSFLSSLSVSVCVRFRITQRESSALPTSTLLQRSQITLLPQFFNRYEKYLRIEEGWRRMKTYFHSFTSDGHLGI